jgi:hypothetical protein
LKKNLAHPITSLGDGCLNKGKKKKKMPEENLPDQALVNLEAYLMGTNPPNEIAINLAKVLLELRRRRFDVIGEGLEWRRRFREYAKHLPICKLLWEDGDFPECTCGLLVLMEKAKLA